MTRIGAAALTITSFTTWFYGRPNQLEHSMSFSFTDADLGNEVSHERHVVGRLETVLVPSCEGSGGGGGGDCTSWKSLRGSSWSWTFGVVLSLSLTLVPMLGSCIRCARQQVKQHEEQQEEQQEEQHDEQQEEHQEQCLVCQERVQVGMTGARCNAVEPSHVWCYPCGLQWAENANPWQLRVDRGFVRCCENGFLEHPAVADLFANQGRDGARPLERYLSRALLDGGDLHEPNENGVHPQARNNDQADDAVQNLVNRILDQMNVRCPSPYCRRVQDPDPDGCAAMTCRHCRCHYCWVCLHISDDDQSNHWHCRLLHGAVFVPPREVQKGHAIWRARAIRELFDHRMREADDVRTQVLERVRPFLPELGLSVEDLEGHAQREKAFDPVRDIAQVMASWVPNIARALVTFELASVFLAVYQASAL